jgi:hypothetical protein
MAPFDELTVVNSWSVLFVRRKAVAWLDPVAVKPVKSDGLTR